MSDLDDAIAAINEAADKTNVTTTFIDDVATLDEMSSVTNSNNGKTAPSIAKRTIDRVDELYNADFSGLTSEVSGYAEEAKLYRDQASEISGLDTVEEAVDLVAPEMVAKGITQASGGMNVYRLDSNGNYNMMVKIPMFTNKVVNDALGTNWLPESDPHPAFIRPDGTTMPWFEVGMYQASNDGNGNPVSAAYKDPYTTITYNTAKSRCSSMGAGWGLMSNAQWAAVSVWCLMNDYQPIGNTFYGHSHESSFLAGVRQDNGINGDAAGSARILTGSGPTEFRHNKAEQGISDMVGNVWEWVDGIKIVEGQIFTAETERQDEIDWVAQPAFLDTGDKLNSSKTGAANTSTEWSVLGKDASYTQNQLLQQHCVEPTVSTTELNGIIIYRNDGERTPLRGGSWTRTSSAGLATLYISTIRTYAEDSIGFRPAYFE